MLRITFLKLAFFWSVNNSDPNSDGLKALIAAWFRHSVTIKSAAAVKYFDRTVCFTWRTSNSAGKS